MTAVVLHDFTKENFEKIRPKYSLGAFLGGSEAPAVMGESSSTSPLTLMMRKLGTEPYPDFSNPNTDIYWIIKRGNDLEPLLLKDAEEMLNVEITKPNNMVMNTEYPWAIHNFDGITKDGWIVEVKTTQAARKINDVKRGEIPKEYLWQGAHYLLMCPWNGMYQGSHFKGVKYIVCFDLQRKPVVLELSYSDWENNFKEQLVHNEKTFIKMFEDGVLPPADGHESTTESLKVYTPGEGEIAALDTHLRLQREYHEAKDKEKEYKEKAASCSNKLKQLMEEQRVKKIRGVCSLYTEERFNKGLLESRLKEIGQVHLIDECKKKNTRFRMQ